MVQYFKNTKLTLKGRPKRDKVVQRDEIISLKIDLNLLTVDEFISKYCLKKDVPHKKNNLQA